VFLDVTGLYHYGNANFRESCDLIMGAGHDLQTHLHPESLGMRRFVEYGLEPPREEEGATEFWPRRVTDPLFAKATNDLAKFKGEMPIAYRAGAYRISNQIIDTLVDLGYRVDSSYDILNKKKHVQLDFSELRENAACMYRGMVELPITAYRHGKNARIKRFVASRHDFDRIDMLKAYRAAGVRVITYILHSYSLMQVYGSREDPNAKIGRLGPDVLAVEHFERELDYMCASGEFRIVDTPTLLTLVDQDPTLLEGPGPILAHGGRSPSQTVEHLMPKG
jgi:hypothetical protein